MDLKKLMNQLGKWEEILASKMDQVEELTSGVTYKDEKLNHTSKE